MDQHYLTPLFAPSSIAVFAGNPELRESDPAYRDAKNLYEALTAQRYTGKFNFLDVDTTEGRLADLINTGADLALVALPPHKVMAALEVAGRIRCKAAASVDVLRASFFQGINHQKKTQLAIGLNHDSIPQYVTSAAKTANQTRITRSGLRLPHQKTERVVCSRSEARTKGTSTE